MAKVTTEVEPTPEELNARFIMPSRRGMVRKDAMTVVHEYPESDGSIAGLLARIYDLEDALAKAVKGFEVPDRPNPDRRAYEKKLMDDWDKKNPNSLVDARGNPR